MEKLFPTGESLIDLEHQTLRMILNTPAFRDTDFMDLLSNANTIYKRDFDSKSPNFAFHASFSIIDDSDVRRVDVGAKINLDNNGEYQQVSYFFTVSGDSQNSRRILRKVHFDFEPLANRNHSEAKPSLHFQIAGTLPPQMMEAGFQDSDLEHLAPYYEKPRIPCLPFSLAILLDVLFHEFRNTSHIGQVLEDTTWRKIVYDAEMKMVYPYMKGCLEFMNKAGRKELFTSHFLYGLDR